MITQYICPDGASIAVEECFEQCRLAKRCLSLATLKRIAGRRHESRKFSVTELLNGTMLEYLRRTNDYAIEPKGRAFALLGQAHHALLEGSADSDAISEGSFAGDDYAGHPDLLEPNGNDTYTLWDYKTWGSYRVARFLGMQKEMIDDPSGAVYQKSGTWGKAGAPKQVALWSASPLVADTFEPTMQLNAYRLLCEKHGYVIGALRLQVTVRDGGLEVAQRRGIMELMYAFDVECRPDADVTSYFSTKAGRLADALLNGWHEPCNQQERWNDERCKRYCEVAQFCPYGQKVREDA